MTGWERLGTGGLPHGFLPGRLSSSAALDDDPAHGAARRARCGRSLVLPGHERAIQRDPNEVIIGM